tara:strand:+ start:148 stop:318 length:171 start_codon:yes stop_codon:yes gene_type:complete
MIKAMDEAAKQVWEQEKDHIEKQYRKGWKGLIWAHVTNHYMRQSSAAVSRQVRTKP